MGKENKYIEKKLLRFLSFRMRSRKEVFDYLIKNDVDDDFAGILIEKYEGLGYIDDDAFTTLFPFLSYHTLISIRFHHLCI